MTFFGLIIAVLVAVLVSYVLSLLPVDPRITRVLQIVVIVALLLWILGGLVGGVRIPLDD